MDLSMKGKICPRRGSMPMKRKVCPWRGPTMLPKMHPVPGAILPPLPTPNLNPSNQLQAHWCNERNSKCGVTIQCGAKPFGAKMWRQRKMRRHHTMWRQNVASRANVASPNNVAPKCGVTGKCGVTKQCGAKQCGAKMWRHGEMGCHQIIWRQTMRRHNVASQNNAASPDNVAPKNVAPHVREMCFHNVSSASGGKVRALLPTPSNIGWFGKKAPAWLEGAMASTWILCHRSSEATPEVLQFLCLEKRRFRIGYAVVGFIGAGRERGVNRSTKWQ